MLDALSDEEVSRIAVDVMYLSTYTKKLESKNFRFQAQIDRLTMHGFLPSRRKFDTHNSLSVSIGTQYMTEYV